MFSKTRQIVGIVCCVLLVASDAFAQVFGVMHTFTNSLDGAEPSGGLVYDGTFLYGTTYSGGTNSNGTLFRIKPDATGYVTLIDLKTSNGKNPFGSPTFFGGSLYFTTVAGGTSGNGTLVSINNPAAVSGFTYAAQKIFATSEGVSCNGSLVLSGANFYGTMFGNLVPAAPPGGDNVFKVQVTGGGFSIITNLSGQNPVGGLALGNGVLYGATLHGGNGAGTVFRIDLATTNYGVIKIFTNLDGASPTGSLLLVGTNLFGTTASGGTAGSGTIFRLNTNGTDYAVLKSFSATSAGGLNSEGASPNGGLVTDGKSLFGTTSSGGSSGQGTVFSINLDGSNFAILKDFYMQLPLPGPVHSNADGAVPNGSLLLAGGKLYGTTSSGGSAGQGVVFRLVVPPQIETGDTNFGVSSSNNFSFDVTGISNLAVVVEASTNLVNWSQVSSRTLDGDPFLFRDSSFVTNSAQRFYRVRVP